MGNKKKRYFFSVTQIKNISRTLLGDAKILVDLDNKVESLDDETWVVKELGVPWTDHTFPPNHTSIGIKKVNNLPG